MSKQTSKTKKMVVLLVVVTMILTVGLMAACCDIATQPTLEQRITNLETEITKLEAIADTKTEALLMFEVQRLYDLTIGFQNEAQKEGLGLRIDALLERLILINAGNPIRLGEFITLQEAYENGLSRDAIMHISHFVTGRVVEVLDSTGGFGGGWGNWTLELWMPEYSWTAIRRIDFTPQQTKPTLADLSERTIAEMKMAFYNEYRVGIENSLAWHINEGLLQVNTHVLDTFTTLEFFGVYDGFYAVKISTFERYTNIAQLVSDIGWVLPDFDVPISIFTRK